MFDYEPLPDPAEAFAWGDLVLAGHLVEIAKGVTKVDARVYPPRSEQEVREALEQQDATIAQLKADGAGEAVIAELEASRERILENEPPDSYSESHYAAFRVQVTEVFKGDIEVGDTLDVQVDSTSLEAVDALTEYEICGTPRVVVGGLWVSPNTEGVLLRGPDGATVDSRFSSFVDLFWFDNGTWEPQGGAVERSGSDLEPEAIYLSGLEWMKPGWGSPETLDDLADALRTAATNPAPPLADD